MNLYLEHHVVVFMCKTQFSKKRKNRVSLSDEAVEMANMRDCEHVDKSIHSALEVTG